MYGCRAGAVFDAYELLADERVVGRELTGGGAPAPRRGRNELLRRSTIDELDLCRERAQVAAGMTAAVDFSGRSLWLDTLAASIVPRPQLRSDITADVVIVGAGLIGLSSAFCPALAEPTLEIVVLEAEIAGFGAAGRNAGCSRSPSRTVEPTKSTSRQRSAINSPVHSPVTPRSETRRRPARMPQRARAPRPPRARTPRGHRCDAAADARPRRRG